MNKSNITGHCLVKNEDRFLWFALTAVLPYLEKIIIYDTGSVDNTVSIIKSLKRNKIEFEQRRVSSPQELTGLRKEQIQRTKTEFFMLIDGDEVWPDQSMKLLVNTLPVLPKNKIAIYCRTRNVVGDVFHYLPEETGRYHLAGKVGNFNMRVFRNIKGMSVVGDYPLESYALNDVSLNDCADRLYFLDTWYLHATHLARSSKPDTTVKTLNRLRKFRIEEGLAMEKKDLPEVFFKEHPPFVPNPLAPRGNLYSLSAKLITPLKRIKRALL